MHPPRPEYPRPHFDRSHSWLGCNGSWDFVADPQHELTILDVAAQATRPITVPFAWETADSGIATQWLTRGWYRRELSVPCEWAGRRIVLHFGAVHHEATVWVNGIEQGTHTGGYLPFEFDITDALNGTSADIVVRVDAPADKRFIAHGKQRSVPRDDYDDCAFTPSSGIWQSVWLESRPATYITGLHLRPSDDLSAIDVEVHIAGEHVFGSTLRLEVEHENVVAEVAVVDTTATTRLTLTEPKRWEPVSPHLYTVRARMVSLDGEDVVTGYTGLRRISTAGTEIRLNDERFYVRGVLDQGYWPGSGITPPSDEAIVRDLELAHEAGFNLVRKHLKLEDPRFLHHADRMGMLVWAEPPSTGRFTPESVAAFESQIEPMVARDANHPSIVIWGLYNEEWGLDWEVPGDPAKQDAVARAFRALKAADPSRHVVDNSGWAHVETDLVDWHVYTSNPLQWREIVAGVADGTLTKFPVHIAPDVVVDKHLMADRGAAPGAPNLNSEYAGGFTSAQRGWHQRWQTQELRRHDILSGYVWTELYDIEHEMAGVYSAHRELKELGGADPALSHAPTTLVLDVDPVEPGRDVLAQSGEVIVPVHVSHHGRAPLDGRLVTFWSPVCTPLDRAAVRLALDSVSEAEEVTAKPFQLTEAVDVVTTLPAGANAARLCIAFVDRDPVVHAVAVLDVHRS